MSRKVGTGGNLQLAAQAIALATPRDGLPADSCDGTTHDARALGLEPRLCPKAQADPRSTIYASQLF